MHKKIRFRPKALLSNADELLIALGKLAKNEPSHREKCLSLISWYRNKQSWTPKQWDLVKYLAKQVPKKRTKRSRPQYLYAITDGPNVKLGFSNDPQKRLTAIQTDQAENLKILWTLYVGETGPAAKREEKRLHKLCKDYRKRGEWYTKDCMGLVKAFKVKERKKKRIKAF